MIFTNQYRRSLHLLASCLGQQIQLYSWRNSPRFRLGLQLSWLGRKAWSWATWGGRWTSAFYFYWLFDPPPGFSQFCSPYFSNIWECHWSWSQNHLEYHWWNPSQARQTTRNHRRSEDLYYFWHSLHLGIKFWMFLSSAGIWTWPYPNSRGSFWPGQLESAWAERNSGKWQH